MRRIVLRTSHRSHAPILAAAQRLIRHNDPYRLEVRHGLDKQLRARRRARRPLPVREHAFPTAAAEADAVAAEIASRIMAGEPSLRLRGPGAHECGRGAHPPKPRDAGRALADRDREPAGQRAGGAGAARVPAGHRRPGVVHGPVCHRDRRTVRPGGRGPHRHRGHGRSPASIPVVGGVRAPGAAGPAAASRTRTRAALGRLVGRRPGGHRCVAPRSRQATCSTATSAGAVATPVSSRPPSGAMTRRSGGSPVCSRSSRHDRRCCADDRLAALLPHLGALLDAGEGSGEDDSMPGGRRGLGAHGAQGQGPRVPGGLPHRAGGRPLPAARSARPAAAAGGLRATRRRATRAPGPRSGDCASWP